MMEYIAHNLFSTEAGVVWLVLKWVLVVLAAGFVGQFGKAFATYLMRRARNPGKREASTPSAIPPATALPQRPVIQEQSSTAQSVSPKDEKKEKKTLAKQQKKLLKNLLK
ncbi:MAG TPA: hypothetical protein VMB77_03435 [Syntrophales bacterium]|nr:hypothetical protein [Syntrophales bacterium]